MASCVAEGIGIGAFNRSRSRLAPSCNLQHRCRAFISSHTHASKITAGTGVLDKFPSTLAFRFSGWLTRQWGGDRQAGSPTGLRLDEILRSRQTPSKVPRPSVLRRVVRQTCTAIGLSPAESFDPHVVDRSTNCQSVGDRNGRRRRSIPGREARQAEKRPLLPHCQVNVFQRLA